MSDKPEDYTVNLLTSKEEDGDFDLRVIVGAAFDYEEYKDRSALELEVAVRMVLNLGDVEYQWPQYGKAIYDELLNRAYDDIAADKLNAKEIQGTYRVNTLEWIKWAESSGYSLPNYLKGIQPGRERQKRVTQEIDAQIMQDAKQVAINLSTLGKKITKDTIIRELQQIDKYKGMGSEGMKKKIKMSEIKAHLASLS